MQHPTPATATFFDAFNRRLGVHTIFMPNNNAKIKAAVAVDTQGEHVLHIGTLDVFKAMVESDTRQDYKIDRLIKRASTPHDIKVIAARRPQK